VARLCQLKDPIRGGEGGATMKENAPPPPDLPFSLIYIKNNRNIFLLCIKAHDIYLSLINVKKYGTFICHCGKKKTLTYFKKIRDK